MDCKMVIIKNKRHRISFNSGLEIFIRSQDRFDLFQSFSSLMRKLQSIGYRS